MEGSKVFTYIKLLFGILIFLSIIKNVLTFFGVSLESYLVYMIWLIVLFIFYLILPSKYPTLFD